MGCGQADPAPTPLNPRMLKKGDNQRSQERSVCKGYTFFAVSLRYFFSPPLTPTASSISLVVALRLPPIFGEGRVGCGQANPAPTLPKPMNVKKR